MEKCPKGGLAALLKRDGDNEPSREGVLAAGCGPAFVLHAIILLLWLSPGLLDSYDQIFAQLPPVRVRKRLRLRAKQPATHSIPYLKLNDSPGHD